MARKAASCPDCHEIDRRQFIKTVGGGLAIGAALPMFGGLPRAWAAPTSKSTAETAVAQFYNSLTADQRKTVCFPFQHELRSRISANWHVTGPKIGDDFYTKEQHGLIEQIVKGVTSEDGYARLQKQMEYDDGGMDFYSVAIFGEPGADKFEWEMTGRHLTLRADGDSVDHAAFGGPIVYGHGEEDPKQNLYHYQTEATNEVFEALDEKQAKQALVEKAPRETAVQLQGAHGKFPGVAVKDLSADQKELVQKTLKTLLAVYREEDVQEVMQILKDSGGVDSLHMAFYQQGDLGNDRKWDIWRVEGPAFVWHFRGAPHVHAYINIGQVKG